MENDIMCIESKFLTGIISKIIAKNLQKKLSVPVNISVTKVLIKNKDGRLKLNAEISGEIYNYSIPELLKNMGIL